MVLRAMSLIIFASGTIACAVQNGGKTPAKPAMVAGTPDPYSLSYSEVERWYEQVLRGLHPDPPSSLGQKGENALHLAAERGSENMMKALFAAGCPLTQDFSGKTPLHYAILSNNIPTALGLLSLEPRLEEVADDNGVLPIHYAATGPESMLRAISPLAFRTINAPATGFGVTALEMAVNTSNLASVRALLALPSLELNKSNPPILILAVMQENPELVRLLLSDPRLEIDARSQQGKSALHLAATRGREDIVRLLLEFEADKTLLDEAGLRPQDYAQDQTIKRLLHHPEPHPLQVRAFEEDQASAVEAEGGRLYDHREKIAAAISQKSLGGTTGLFYTQSPFGHTIKRTPLDVVKSLKARLGETAYTDRDVALVLSFLGLYDARELADLPSIRKPELDAIPGDLLPKTPKIGRTTARQILVMQRVYRAR